MQTISQQSPESEPNLPAPQAASGGGLPEGARPATVLEFLDAAIDTWGRTLRLIAVFTVVGTTLTTALVLTLDSGVWTIISGSWSLAILVSMASNLLTYETYRVITKWRVSRAVGRPVPGPRAVAVDRQGSDPPRDDGQGGGDPEPQDYPESSRGQ